MTHSITAEEYARVIAKVHEPDLDWDNPVEYDLLDRTELVELAEKMLARLTWGGFAVQHLDDLALDEFDLPAAGGVSPTAPDEREALHPEDRTALAQDWVKFYYAGMSSKEAKAFKAGWAAGFRRSREATTEPQPEPEWEYTTAARDGGPSESRYRSWGSVDPRHAKFRRRKAGPWIPVEAVEASRSPKPTEVER
tara:strand:- start:1220 stop:1804 length:585 start_codon:yes stop_codon:yes gene_type:complete